MRQAAVAAALLLLACDGSSDAPVPGGTDLTIAEGRASPSDVAWDGEAYAVVYAHVRSPSARPPEDDGSTDDLVFARVAPDGAILVAPKVVYDLDLDVHSLRVTANGDGYVAWYRSSGRAVRTLALDALGEAIGAPTDVAPAVSSDRELAIAGDASGYGILFVSDTSPTDVSFRAVSPQGQPVGMPIPIEARSAEQRGPALALASPGAFTAVWSEGTVLYGATLSADGTITTPGAPINDATSNYDPVVATIDPTSHLVAAHDSAWNTLRLYLVRNGTSVWEEPLEALPESRDARVLYDIHADGDVATVAYRSDSEYAVPQIVVTSIRLSTASVFESRVLTGPRFSWGDVALARGDGGFGVVFSGVVRGSERIYFVSVPD
jgi:hypothetical protein